MAKKKIDDLVNRGIKLNQIKLLKRKTNLSNYREINLVKGSIWNLPDKSVPFDNKRKNVEITDKHRPCLVLETPTNYKDFSIVSLAPGTSKFHANNINDTPTLIAKVPPENLPKTTFFLIYFRWNSVQKVLEKKVGEISEDLLNELDKLLVDYE